MPTITAGTSPLVTIPRGSTMRVTGTGLATLMGSARSNQVVSIVTKAAIGPFDSAQDVSMYATTDLVYSFDADMGFLVVSASAPNNNDGRPDGTIYIQTA